jgi:hypothetical protein
MFSFFSSPASIGIQCTDTAIRAVLTRKNRVEGRAKRELPAGAITKGMAKDPQKVADALTSVLKELQVSNATVALCLPPEKVYCQLLNLSSSTSEAIRSAASALIPEPWEDLVTASDMLSAGIAFAAMRKDVLKGYAEFCTLAGVRPAVMSSTSAFLATALAKRSTEKQSIVLVREPSDIGEPATITLFRDGHPIEEQIVRDIPNLARAVVAFHHQAKQKQQVIGQTLVFGSDTLLPRIQEALAPVHKPANKKGKQMETSASPAETIPLEQAFASIPEAEREWFCAEIASLQIKEAMLSFS